MKNAGLEKVFITASFIAILAGACSEFYDVAQGTGTWWNGFAASWAIFFVIFCFACLFAVAIWIYLVFNPRARSAITEWWFNFRDYMGLFRWFLALAIGLLPVLLFQISVWGIVFQGFFIRSIVWALVVFFMATLVSDKEKAIDWKDLLAILVFTGAIFAVVSTLRNVTNYPFSLGWSEGNRLWDYSIMFGRDRYIYPPDEKIYVLLSLGRQFIGGLPFLLSGNNILTQRLWVSLIDIIPYLIFGMALFGSEYRNWRQYLLLILWTYLFLNQGPIHPPLILSAFLIAVAWRNPLWSALPLVVIGAGFAGVSRYTWMFAPAMWIFILELSKIASKSGRTAWIRLLLLTMAALVSGVLLQAAPKAFQDNILSFQSFVENSNATPGNIQEKIVRQALLWYRLFPNSTYGPGIVLGLVTAIGSLLLLIYHVHHTKVWETTYLQKLAFIMMPLTFLGVGLTISVKIGGGGDLHNLDMFLIALAFIMAIIWRQGGREWLMSSATETPTVKLLLVVLLIIPGLTPLSQMRSHGYYDLFPWLAALTDASSETALDLLPSQAVVTNSLEVIRSNIETAQLEDEILFIDQRQLLTFGYVKDIPLVPEYDKKVLMERAFTQNRDYFNRFYIDLENRRFSLIIVQPLTIAIQGGADQFSEENNTWVRWVARPLLCFYEVKLTLREVNVQLLTPRSEVVDCSSKLP